MEKKTGSDKSNSSEKSGGFDPNTGVRPKETGTRPKETGTRPKELSQVQNYTLHMSSDTKGLIP